MRAPLVPIAEKSTTEKVRFAEDAWNSRAAVAELNSAASNPDQQRAERHGVKATFFLVDVTNQHLAEIARLVDGGKLRTNVGLTPRGRARGPLDAGTRAASAEGKDCVRRRSEVIDQASSLCSRAWMCVANPDSSS